MVSATPVYPLYFFNVVLAFNTNRSPIDNWVLNCALIVSLNTTHDEPIFDLELDNISDTSETSEITPEIDTETVIESDLENSSQ